MIALTFVAIATLMFVGGCQEAAKTQAKPTISEQAKPAVQPVVKAEPVAQKPVAKTEAPKAAAQTAKPAVQPAPKAVVAAEKPQAPVAKPAVAKIATPAQAVQDEKFKGVEAIVNGTPITTEQVKSAIKDDLDQIDKQLPENVRDTYKNREIMKAVQNMVEEKLVDEQIAKAGIVITEQDVDSYINKNLADANMTMEQLTQKIKADGMTFEQWKEKMQFRKGLAFEKLTEKQFESQLKVEPKDVNDFYTKNPQYFDMPEQVRASHILIKAEEGKDPNQAKIAAKAKAEDILKEVKAGGDFAELAKKYSSCPSAKNGGDLGLFSRNKMVKPFEEAAFAMKVGQISDVVETQFGYHIIKVTDRKSAEKITFAKAEKDITNFLKMQKRQQLEKAYKENLMKTASIVYPPGKDPKEMMSRRPMMPGMPGQARPQSGKVNVQSKPAVSGNAGSKTTTTK